MQIKSLFSRFDDLQNIYGDRELDAIYGCGETERPKICLVFMNPTARNVSAQKTWAGLKAPWIGTKHVWSMLGQLNLFDNDLVAEINSKIPAEWNYDFADKVYNKVKEKSLYITNLSKATQVDARPLADEVFRKYLDLFKQEIARINPGIIITFGNQVSSVLFGKPVTVSSYRKRFETLNIESTDYKVFPVYYPVGQGMRNIKLAKEDMSWIIKNFL